MRKNIYVYAGWLETVPLIGIYSYDHEARITMFRYDDSWITQYKMPIDPELSPLPGWQYLNKFSGKQTFGFIADASPDRWGKGLIRRKEHYAADRENRHPRTLFPEDYLLGVSDEGRSGGLRFKSDQAGAFLSEENDIPKITAIRTLQDAVDHYTDPDRKENEKWLNDIFVPGSSLGGARPKANVYDLHGSLWIAKFPARSDETDLGAWEMTAAALARKCHICTPDTNIIPASEFGHIFLSRRFDRVQAARIHMMSAMTALGQADGDAAVSFLDIAEYVASGSSRPEEDLKELFRRVAFFVCISNTDCHLRNHSFLLTPSGWCLSPAYDMNPNTDKDQLALNITDTKADIDLRLVLETAEFYRLSREEALEEIQAIQKAVAGWRKTAASYKIPEKEIAYMTPAFKETERKL